MLGKCWGSTMELYTHPVASPACTSHMNSASLRPSGITYTCALLYLSSTVLFSLFAARRQFLAPPPLCWPTLGCWQWASANSFQPTLSAKRSFLGQPNAPETAVLNTRPGAEPMLCSELFFFYSRQQSQPIHLLGFWIQSSFLLKNHPFPAQAALCRSGASRTALLPSPGASNSRRV